MATDFLVDAGVGQDVRDWRVLSNSIMYVNSFMVFYEENQQVLEGFEIMEFFSGTLVGVMEAALKVIEPES